MSDCPDIDELLSSPSPTLRAHLAGCPACGSVAALIAARPPRPSARARATTPCAELEPAIAAMVDGTIHRLELGRLAAHLAECGACSELASRLTLVRPELDDVPEAAAASPTAPGETTVVSRRPTANGARGGGLGKRMLGVLVPPPGLRVAWAAQLAVVALGSWAIARAVGGSAPPIEAAHDRARGIEAAPAGSPEVARATERARAAEQAQKEAEDRALKAEERLIEAEKRIGDLEEKLHPTPHATPSASATSKPEPSVDPLATRHDSDPLDGRSSGAEPPGFLTVVCNPFCDDVLDGGRSLGPSPVVHLAVKPGNHRITLRRNGFPSKVLSVVVVSGQVTAQRVAMGPASPSAPVIQVE